MKKNEQGFTGLEGALIAVVICLIGGISFYVYASRQKVEKSVNTTQAQTKPVETSTPQPQRDTEAENWQLITSAKKGFSVRVPDGWKGANYAETDNVRIDNVQYNKGTKAVIENIEYPYAGDSLVRLQIVSSTDATYDSYMESFVGQDAAKTAFTVAGIDGTRYYKKQDLKILDGVGPIPGEETYGYSLKKDNRRIFVIYRILNVNEYSADFLKTNYNQTTSDPSQVELVERMLKTLRIN